MQKFYRFKRIGLVLFTWILALGILTTSSAGLAAAIHSAPILYPEIIISELNNWQLSPKVAYDFEHDEYLVVWENHLPANKVISARRISSTGQVLDSFTVAPSQGNIHDRSMPSVAYDPVNDRYLVIFLVDVVGDGSRFEIGGRFIPWNGIDNDMGEFPLLASATTLNHPDLTYASTKQEFLVVVENYPNGQPSFIYAARVNPQTGEVINIYSISDLTLESRNPAVAYNHTRNEYLVVWDYSSTSNIRGISYVRLDANCNPLSPGIWAPIAANHYIGSPTVAACPQADQYLVAWVEDPSNTLDFDVSAEFVSGDGSNSSSTIVDARPGDQLGLDAACLHNGYQYLLAWESYPTSEPQGVYARLVDGVVFGEPFILAEGASSAAIAGSRVNFITVWDHQRSSYYDIYGRLVFLHQLYLPLIDR